MKLSPLLAAVAVVALGAFFWQRQQTSELRAEVTRIQAEHQAVAEKKATEARSVEKLQTQIADYKAVVSQLEQRNKELAATVPAKPPAPESALPASDATTAPDSPPTEKSFMKSMAQMWNDPDMKETMRAQQAVGVQMIYGSLAKELNLSPAEARKVMDLLTDRQAATMAESMKSLAEGSDPAAPKNENAADLRKAFDEELRNTLGADRYRAFKDYEGSLTERMAVDQFERQLSSTGVALNPQQSRGLLNILKDEKNKSDVTSLMGNGTTPPSDEAIERWQQEQTDYNRRVVDRARSMFTPDQILALETAQKQWQAAQEMGLKMSRKMRQP